MAELRLVLSQDEIDEINARRREIDSSAKALSLQQIGKQALGLYRWAVTEMAQKRAVGSADPDDGMMTLQVQLRGLAMETAEQRAKRALAKESPSSAPNPDRPIG